MDFQHAWPRIGNGWPLPAPHTSQNDSTRGEVILQVQNLRKKYGSLVAIDNLNFNLHQGEIFGLLGLNGAGKSTAISMLSTELPATGGDALVCGHSIRREPSLARRWIGLVPSEIALYPTLTVAENLRFFGRISGVARAQLKPRIDELLQYVGLEARRDHYVTTLSGGMKRRLNIIVALVHRPRLVLLDEPTVGVDLHSREQIIQLARGLRDQGAAVLYTTHHMEEAQALCDRIAILHEGVLVAAGRLDELLASLEYTDTIEISGLPNDFDLCGLEALDLPCRVERGQGMVRLLVKNAVNFLGPVQKIVSSYSQPVKVAIVPSTLEQLFLQLTRGEARD
jgi:ABC-2 type transport system ATP-binding protein